jgi:hypothetical protein
LCVRVHVCVCVWGGYWLFRPLHSGLGSKLSVRLDMQNWCTCMASGSG